MTTTRIGRQGSGHRICIAHCWCGDDVLPNSRTCCDQHSATARVRAILRVLPATGGAVRDALDHLYPRYEDGSNEREAMDRRFSRDMKAAGATLGADRVWRVRQ